MQLLYYFAFLGILFSKIYSLVTSKHSLGEDTHLVLDVSQKNMESFEVMQKFL